MFPQTPSNTGDPYTMTNLTDWKQKIEEEIQKWRLDNNYIPILPLPVGQQTLGAQGRALMLSQEYRVWAEHIVAGMGVPNEFIFGGLSYSGSSVSLRMLENHFLDYKSDHLRLVYWIIERVGAFLNWEPVEAHFRRFKMADDLQRSAFNLQLNQAGKISDKTLLEDTDWDSEVERKVILKEQQISSKNQLDGAISEAQIQGEAQLAGLKYQARAQRMMSEMGAVMPEQQDGEEGFEQNASNTEDGDVAAPGNGSMEEYAQAVAAKLHQVDEATRAKFIQKIKQENPALWKLVEVALAERQGAHQSSAQLPQPEQKAPRRGAESTT